MLIHRHQKALPSHHHEKFTNTPVYNPFSSKGYSYLKHFLEHCSVLVFRCLISEIWVNVRMDRKDTMAPDSKEATQLVMGQLEQRNVKEHPGAEIEEQEHQG